ncbi:MAG: UDP-glucose 4-epimerase GalE [Desulfovibrionaceae bacterium]|nr:UDP-glucose 4-epimerase GalE [Desulfovibrionaceae bacterium]
MATVLVCGGAGYIGSHMLRALVSAGFRPVVFDSLVKGHVEAVPADIPLIRGDLLDIQALRRVFSEYDFEAVLHFAARIEVGESVREPGLYYQNNVGGSLNLLTVMHEFGVKKLVFSSTAAVYGNPVQERISENHPCMPINPYGRSKWMVEQMIEDFSSAFGLKAVCLRYFNAAGADPGGEIGEAHNPESHLIPNVLKAAVSLNAPEDDSSRFELNVFGSDYPTPDGTCVRDYIHVCDLCQAHLLALNYLDDFEGKAAFNLGSGNGYSIMQVIEAAERVSGCKIPYSIGPRRPGDAAVLVADSSLARSVLGWKPALDDLDMIVKTAWNWETGRKY